MQLEGEVLGYKKKTVVLVAALVVLAGVMFYAGAKYEKGKLTKLGLVGKGTVAADQTTKKSKKTAVTPAVPVTESVWGKVTAKTATTLAVKLADGTTQTVTLAPATTVSRSGAAALATLYIGEPIQVTATKNADGTLAATDVSTTPSPAPAMTPPATTNKGQ